MRNQQGIKLFLVLILCTSYIYGFSQFGVQAYDSFWNKNSSFEEGTFIGSVDVSEKTKSEAIQLVKQQAEKWKKESEIQLRFKEKTVAFDNSLINYQIEESVNKAVQGQKNSVPAVIESIDTFFSSSVSATLSNSVYDFEKIKTAILSKAIQLQEGKYEVKLGDFLVDPQMEKENVISKVELQSKISENDVALLKGQLTKIELKPMSQFSLLDRINELGLKQVSQSTYNLLATGVYQVVLPTNFSIIERQISKELPKYAQLGYEAKVNVDKKMDLVFSNPNESSYTVKLDWNKSSLTVSLLGPSFLNQYRLKTKDKETFKPKTIVQFNPQLSQLQKIVEEEGKEGLLIHVIRETYDENGKLLKTEQISEDFYPPIHRIEVQGLILEEGSSDTEENHSGTTEETDDETDSEDTDESNPPTNEDENAQG